MPAASLGLFLTPATAVAAEPAVEPAAAPAAAQAPAPSAAQIAVDTARAQVGKAYQYGGNGPPAASTARA